MAFVVRQIARRADGGEIVRTRTIAAMAISVGRGTDCDVQVADLGVMLRHLRLALVAEGVVEAVATGGVPLEIAGVFVNRTELAVAARPAIDLAGHRLTLAPGDGAGDVTVTVERVAAVVAHSGDAAAGVFSLAAVLPGKRLMAWGFLVVVLGGLLAFPWFSRSAAVGKRADIVWNSGPLSTAHAGLRNNCGACHQAAFVSVTDGACVACHKPAVVPAHAAAGRMTQGRVLATGFVANIHKGLHLPEGRCASCHSEHEGPQGALLVAASYCTDCHSGLTQRLPDSALKNVENWPGHPEFSVAPERSRLVFGHGQHLSATNAVANMAQKQGLAAGGLGCGDCHRPDRDGVRFKAVEMERDCGACHDLAFAEGNGVVRTLPHGKPDQVIGIVRGFYAARGGVMAAAGRRTPGIGAGGLRAASAGAAIAGIFGPKGVCSDCHGVLNTGPGRFGIVPVRLTDHYLRKGDFPHKRHKLFGKLSGDAACAACHKGVAGSNRAEDLLLPSVAVCKTCHGKAAAMQAAPAACETCHAFHYDTGETGVRGGRGRVVAGRAATDGGA